MCRFLYRESIEPITEKEEEELKFKAGLKAMERGGPNEQSYIEAHANGRFIQAGHNRLSIQNIEGGHQPKFNGNGILLYNGELYDPEYVAIRYNLPIQEEGDTEVLFRKLQKDDLAGTSMNNPVNIYQEESAFLYRSMRGSGPIYLYRGNMGIKPLYFYKDSKQIIVSSEIKGIIAITGERLICPAATREVLIMGYTGLGRTIYSNIHKVYPNERLQIERINNEWKVDSEIYQSSLTIRPNQTTNYLPHDTYREDRLINLKNALGISVRKRITNSDVPVSITLSGGVDSAIITYLATKHSKTTPITYTLAFKGFPNEIEKARNVTRFLGIEDKHNIIEVDFDKFLTEDLDDFLEAMDEPMDKGSMIPTYYLAKNIKEKVTLVGEGADELFGGYNRHESAVNHDYEYTIDPLDTMFRNKYVISLDAFNYNIQRSLVAVPMDLRGTGLSDLLAYDQKTELPEYHNMRLDKMMMHFGKEVRLPYLDVGVMRVAHTIGQHIIEGEDDQIIRKAYLRKAFAHDLPDWFLSPPKEALKIPYNDLVEHPIIKDYLLNPSVQAIIKDASNVDINIKDIYDVVDLRNRGRLLWLLFITAKWLQKHNA